MKPIQLLQRSQNHQNLDPMPHRFVTCTHLGIQQSRFRAKMTRLLDAQIRAGQTLINKGKIS